VKSPFLPFIIFVSFFSCRQCLAQGDTTHKLEEVIISGFQPDNAKLTSLNIESYSLQQINERSPYNLSDALAKLPGISQITTGNSISKPVIRGLYGNRILVLLSGTRFDNQQWQDEHGLGLSQIGISKAEVIKGPASLLYGSDAMGGIINVIEEKPLFQGIHTDGGTQLYTNTRGMLTDAGISKRTGDKWWRLRLGGENHADYADGSNTRVLNSRNSGYYAKAGFGWMKGNWTQENSYNFSYNQYGFILEGLTTFFPADARWNRSYGGPHHNVMLNILNSQNTFRLKSSVLKVNAGIQSNIRKEDEGGGQISLDIRLLSGLQNARWEKRISPKTLFVANQQLTYENNTNYGPRILIPDATFLESNLSGYFKFTPGNFVLEAGAGANNKYIKTLRTKTLNAPGESIQPFTTDRTTGNGMVGIAWNPNNWLTIKTNSASGFRAPNLAELSSNGLHEGVYRYEIGDPNLKTEQNINTDLSLEADKKWLFLSVAGFHNRFLDYVYLAPTAETFYSFPVFRYRQQNARLYGAEGYFTIAPGSLQGWQWKETYSLTRGTLDNGGNMPFIPAAKLASAIRWEKKLNGTVSYLFAEPEFVYVFNQDLPAQFETATQNYYLLNFSSGLTVSRPAGNWKLGLAGTNLTNRVYYDHLSRLKYYGLYNTGLNFAISIRKEFK